MAISPLIFHFYKTIETPDNLKNKLLPGEKEILTLKTFRDAAVFTDKRVLIADKQGLTGSKIQYTTIPYKSIVMYAIETAGTLDFDAEIKLYLSGGIYCEFTVMKGPQITELLKNISNILTQYVVT